MRARNAELGLLVTGAVVIVAAYVLASLGRLAEIPANIVPFLLVILGLLLVAHVATRRLAPLADPVLLPLAGLLNGIGYVFIARLDEDLAGLQATWTLVGVAAFVATLLVVRRVRWLEQYRYTLMLVGIGLLVLPLAPVIGQEINGARIWVSLGPINFQPGEFAKIALAVFFAAYLVEKREVLALSNARLLGMAIPEARHLGPILMAWAASLLVMVSEKDLGSSLLFFALFVVLLWVATERPSYLLMSVVLFAGGSALAYSRFGHVRERVDVWLDPFADPFGNGFQVTQAAFALADGGLTGTGLGVGSPNTQNIPAVETDFIFAIIGEELGLLGSTAILIAFMLMIGGGLRVAITADRPFDKLLATGLTTLLGVQAFIIIAGVIRVLPLTGVTLPFVSYGGSSLLANWVLLALLLRISDDTAQRRLEDNEAAVAVPETQRGVSGMNSHIRFLGLGLITCFVVLFVQLNRVQLVQQEELQANPANNRQIERDFSRPRGSIFTADGVVIATSVEVDNDLERERTYPERELYAHTTGFFSFQFGADGLEREFNDQLAGQTIEQRYDSFSDLFRDTDTTANVTTTLRHDLQIVARDALGDRRGSVVAIDPRTGEILAFWSFPSFDPSVLGSVELVAAEQYWNELSALSPADDPRLPRMYREIYFPGSTFKVVTAAAALDANVATMSEPVFDASSEYVAPLTTVALRNFGGGTCGGDMLEALRASCNTAFAELAAEVIGADPMIEMAERFGFNDAPPLDLPAVAESVFPTDFGTQVGTTDGEPPVPILENTPALAQAGIGQNDVKASPLQMALVAAAIANDGLIAQPHLVAEIRDQQGGLIEETEPTVWRSALSSTDASTLRAAMITTATNGTATGLAVPGYEVGGKTGTAQVDAERPDDTHAWIIGFGGPRNEPATVAVAVIVESIPGAGQQTGGTTAAPIARAVLEAALE